VRSVRQQDFPYQEYTTDDGAFFLLRILLSSQIHIVAIRRTGKVDPPIYIKVAWGEIDGGSMYNVNPPESMDVETFISRWIAVRTQGSKVYAISAVRVDYSGTRFTTTPEVVLTCKI
jgi:hypothetical protein